MARLYPEANALITQATTDDESLRVSWRFGDADRGGPWAWSDERINPAQVQAILMFFAEMDKLTWALASQGWKPRRKRIDPAGICDEAQNRLRTIGKDAWEHLEELRMSGPERIWGFRIGHVSHALWWDPDHTVWPTDPD